MVTLLKGLMGRCDGRCYKSKTKGCRCVCGGRNHGVGLALARVNTRSFAEEMARKAADEVLAALRASAAEGRG